MEVLLIVEHI